MWRGGSLPHLHHREARANEAVPHQRHKHAEAVQGNVREKASSQRQRKSDLAMQDGSKIPKSPLYPLPLPLPSPLCRSLSPFLHPPLSTSPCLCPNESLHISFRLSRRVADAAVTQCNSTRANCTRRDGRRRRSRRRRAGAGGGGGGGGDGISSPCAVQQHPSGVLFSRRATHKTFCIFPPVTHHDALEQWAPRPRLPPPSLPRPLPDSRCPEKERTPLLLTNKGSDIRSHCPLSLRTLRLQRKNSPTPHGYGLDRPLSLANSKICARSFDAWASPYSGYSERPAPVDSNGSNRHAIYGLTSSFFGRLMMVPWPPIIQTRAQIFSRYIRYLGGKH
jgi:hypothetical protein